MRQTFSPQSVGGAHPKGPRAPEALQPVRPVAGVAGGRARATYIRECQIVSADSAWSPGALLVSMVVVWFLLIIGVINICLGYVLAVYMDEPAPEVVHVTGPIEQKKTAPIEQNETADTRMALA